MSRALLFVALCAMSTFAHAEYTAEMFRQALSNTSTRPTFVLIVLRGSGTDPDRTVCIEAPYLLGAIHIENHLSNSQSDYDIALQIALAAPDRAFLFKNKDARLLVTPGYDLAQLQEVRLQLQSLSDEQLRTALSKTSSTLHDLYQNHTTDHKHGAYLQAIAHVLLERGVLVGMTDIVASLYLVQ